MLCFVVRQYTCTVTIRLTVIAILTTTGFNLI